MLVVLPKLPVSPQYKLSSEDMAAIADVIRELYAPDMVLEQFPRRVLELLGQLIPYKPVTSTATVPQEGELRLLGLPKPDSALLERKLDVFLELHESFARLDFDPIASGGRTLLGGDWLSSGPFRDTAAYRENLRLLSGGDFLALPVHPETRDGENIYLGFFRPPTKKGDFQERERAILVELQPHLVRALDVAELRSAISGQPLNPLMLRMVLPITPRQADILAWIAAGKTNAEIALILNLKEGNVKLHVGAVLRRLGVENRTTAALVALEALLKAQATRASIEPRRSRRLSPAPSSLGTIAGKGEDYSRPS